MRHVTFYHRETGLFHGMSVLVSDDAAVPMNTPKGYEAIDHPQGAMLDSLSQRVDVERLAREDDEAATSWAAKKDENRLARTAGGDPGEDPPPPARTIATIEHVVDYQPAAPSGEHEWNTGAKRWQFNAVATARIADRAQVRATLAALELKERALLRAVALNRAGALEELAALDAQISALEGRL